MKNSILICLISVLLVACSSTGKAAPGSGPSKSADSTGQAVMTETPATAPTRTVTPVVWGYDWYGLPDFEHIILIFLQNEYLQNVIGSRQMPNFNKLAGENVLLVNYHAVAHPSLPNFLAILSGSTQNIDTNCLDCFVDKPNLADEIEASGRTWRAYFEDMPSPCFVGKKKPYGQMFNPFIYFDSIRLNQTRCENGVVPLTYLDEDLANGRLSNFVYIMPNMCNSGHDCTPAIADKWLGEIVAKLQASSALGENSLIVITFDEGVHQSQLVYTSGELATVLISPLAQAGLIDDTRYNHYTLLKTILTAWDLPLLGETRLESMKVIQRPWIDQLDLLYSYPMQSTP